LKSYSAGQKDESKVCEGAGEGNQTSHMNGENIKGVDDSNQEREEIAEKRRTRGCGSHKVWVRWGSKLVDGL